MPAVFGRITSTTPCASCKEDIVEEGQAAVEFEPDSEHLGFYTALVFHPECLVTGKIRNLEELLEDRQ